MDNVYKQPDQAILLRYGFKKTGNGIYEAFFAGTSLTLIFYEGMIRLTEQRGGERYRIRLNKIQLENDDELDVILRQTMYLPVFKAALIK